MEGWKDEPQEWADVGEQRAVSRYKEDDQAFLAGAFIDEHAALHSLPHALETKAPREAPSYHQIPPDSHHKTPRTHPRAETLFFDNPCASAISNPIC
ncbi:hypothetical protein PGT21_023151 [Puccinia graminis f. sp. tritici]|uniref:Uncharacterized protein n=1 Tax=Puccinia graminis f. sp. tritici TaxID=56615 RepID=A0A5B0LVW8_PUCGR|nr:hypothetical protein PGT21_023151 [Puccinia graminis f. sp. tritici]